MVSIVMVSIVIFALFGFAVTALKWEIGKLQVMVLDLQLQMISFRSELNDGHDK